MIARVSAFLARWFAQPDKVLHVLIGLAAFAIPMSASMSSGAPLAVRLVASLVGVAVLAWAKERYDKHHPDKHTADGWDAYATSVGAHLGAVAWLALGLP